MKCLVTVMIRDHDGKYFDYFTMEGTVEEVEQKAKKMIDNENRETYEEIKSVIEISDKDRNVLINYGVI